eukprot:scaffold259210_cov15-Prasinocladus_malaysianus.AAC.1
MKCTPFWPACSLSAINSYSYPLGYRYANERASRGYPASYEYEYIQRMEPRRAITPPGSYPLFVRAD